jgi:hypothetical protein
MRTIKNYKPDSIAHKLYIKKSSFPKDFYFIVADFYEAGQIYTWPSTLYHNAVKDYGFILVDYNARDWKETLNLAKKYRNDFEASPTYSKFLYSLNK